MTEPAAIIVSPAAPGSGGLGGATGAMELGLRQCGFAVDVVRAGRGQDWLSRASRMMRNRHLEVELQRRRAQRSIPTGWDLAYSMPGYLPRDGAGLRVLHQATAHPRTALDRMRVARRAAGGGSLFLSSGSVRMLEAELGAADLVRTESIAVRDDLIARGLDPAKVVHAYPGVDLHRFHPRERAPGLQVAFVGALALWKGVDLLVQVESRMRGRARFVVAGGPVCRWSRRLVADLPFHYDHDVPRVVGCSDVLLLPSATDGFGYVVLEALAAGCVPIVTEEVGAAELVRSLHPDLAQPRATYADRVPELLETLPLAELSMRARALAEDFAHAKMAREAAAAVLQGLGRPLPAQEEVPQPSR
jgi:glycosyltransferase involved in cell wall biosynthesis